MPDTLTVQLGERSYPIFFGADLAPEIRAKVVELANAGRKVAVVTDRHVAARHKGALQAIFGKAPVWVALPGEETKSVAEWGRLLEFLAALRLGRTGALFTVGGGVIGDLGGFAAAAYLRGIDFFQVPTTLLAMVDSSVGGKTGVNLAAGKNLAGAFHQPRAVFVSTGFLATLPPREFAAGMAEVIKCALLADEALFAEIEKAPIGPASQGLAGVIRRCCAAKALIVEADEHELAPEGGRALLNLGHTFGHAIERASGYGSYLHGEAVAIGLCAAARLSRELGLISAADAARIETALSANALPVRLRAPLSVASLTAAAAQDKKARPEGMRFVVLKRIGEAQTVSGIEPPLVEACFKAIGAT